MDSSICQRNAQREDEDTRHPLREDEEIRHLAV